MLLFPLVLAWLASSVAVGRDDGGAAVDVVVGGVGVADAEASFSDVIWSSLLIYRCCVAASAVAAVTVITTIIELLTFTITTTANDIADSLLLLLPLVTIYTIICLKSVCLATFAQCSSQFWLNRVGRCLKLIASTRGTFCHEFASQFGIDFFYTPKNRKPLSPAYFDPRCGDKQRNWKRQNRGNSAV